MKADPASKQNKTKRHGAGTRVLACARSEREGSYLPQPHHQGGFIRTVPPLHIKSRPAVWPIRLRAAVGTQRHAKSGSLCGRTLSESHSCSSCLLPDVLCLTLTRVRFLWLSCWLLGPPALCTGGVARGLFPHQAPSPQVHWQYV